MIVDLFLRTYSSDVQWLPFLFRSLIRHARKFRKLIVITPFSSIEYIKPVVDLFATRLIAAGVVSHVSFEECPTWRNDYNGQQATKLQAYVYSSADEVLYLDSDLVLIHELRPETRSGLIEARPWDRAGGAVCWRGVTEHLLGLKTPYETMCRHPFQYPIQLVRRCLEHVTLDRAMSIKESGVIHDGKPMVHFSEFNLMGSYAHLVEGRPVTVVGSPNWQPDTVKQFWSYGGITVKVREELQQLGYWEDEF